MREGRLIDDTGRPDRKHMGSPDRRANDSRPPLHTFTDQAAQPVGQVVAVILRRFMAVVDGQGEEDAALMVHPAQAGMGDRIDALLAAIVRMGPPVDVGQQAGGMAQSALFGRFFQRRIGEELIGPVAEFIGVRERPGAEAGVILTEADERIARSLVGRQKAVDQPFADSEDREYDLARLHQAQQPLENQRAEGKHLAARPGDASNARDVRRLLGFAKLLAEVERFTRRQPVALHHAERIIDPVHLQLS